MEYHTKISFIKSGIRVLGYAGLYFSPVAGISLLIIAEIFGVIEEL